MDSRAARWSGKTVDLLIQVDLASEVSSLLPQLISEMETLRALTVDRKKPEPEQKKQAGFIQQRKRARLNELFKTLQRLGFSYRFGVTNCTDINNYEEMYKHVDSRDNLLWRKSDKYFFRSFSRFRHLLTLLDRAPPPDIGCSLHERFQGFVQHMLSVAKAWRNTNADLVRALASLSVRVEQFEEEKQFDLSRDGAKYRALLFTGLDLVETLRINLEQKSLEYTDLNSQLQPAAEKCATVQQSLTAKLRETETVFAPSGNRDFLASLSSPLSEVSASLNKALEQKKSHPVVGQFEAMASRLKDFLSDLDKWCMQMPASRNGHSGVDIQVSYNFHQEDEILNIKYFCRN